MTTATPPPKSAGIRLTRRSAAYWRVTIDNPPINVMSPEMIGQFHEVVNALETDDDVRVVVFDSAVDDYFLNHSDFTANFDDFTALPAGPTGLPQWPRPARCRTRRVRRSAGDPNFRIRQMGHRQYQAARQHEPATGRRARRRLGCVHGLDRAAGCPGRRPSTDGARLSPTWRGGKSSRVLPRPNQTVSDNRAIWQAGLLAVAEGGGGGI
jgi:hypothetical protein